MEGLENIGKAQTSPIPDYLSFVDDDIREMFEGRTYHYSDLLMMQLIKELRKMNKPKHQTRNGYNPKSI